MGRARALGGRSPYGDKRWFGPVARLGTRFGDLGRATETLGPNILSSLRGVPLDEEEGPPQRAAGLEESEYSAHLNNTEGMKAEILLTRNRLLLNCRSEAPPPSTLLRLRAIWSNPTLRGGKVISGLIVLVALSRLLQGDIGGFVSGVLSAGVVLFFFSAIQSSPGLLARLFGLNPQISVRCDVFVNRMTRVSALPLNEKKSAFVISWGLVPPNAEQLRQVFSKHPLSWQLAGATPNWVVSMGEFKDSLVLPVDRGEAEAVSAELNRHLMSFQEEPV